MSTVSIQYEGSGQASIAASVEAAVRTGELAPGDQLPAVRRLAGDLGVSPATVASAYRLLKRRAIVEADRSGTRVRRRPAVTAAPALGPAALGPATPGGVAAPGGVRDLSGGGPDPRLLPTLGPRLAGLAASPELAAPGGYDVAGALPALLDASRSRLAADGVPVGEASLAATGGALDGIERLLIAHTEPGDRVAVEDPGWANLFDLLAMLRLEAVPVPVDDDGPTVTGMQAALAAGVGAVVVTSRAQNPTGAAISAERGADLRELLATHPDLLVIEDDHAAELSDVALAPIVGSTPSWAFVRSTSKPFGPDLRVAVIAGDEATVSRVAGRQLLGAGWVSTVLQRLVLALWSDPDVDELVARARTSYARRRDALREALGERGVVAHGRTGLNVWIPVADETSTIVDLRDHGWALAPGAPFRLRGGPAVRITVSSLDQADVEPLADAVARAVGTTRRGFTV